MGKHGITHHTNKDKKYIELENKDKFNNKSYVRKYVNKNKSSLKDGKRSVVLFKKR